MDDVLEGRDVTALAELVKSREVTPRELVEAALGRIDERNPAVNAVVEQRRNAALEDAERAEGPLAGIPFVTKDLGADVAGMRSTGGSRLWAEHVPTTDSVIVGRYRKAGLVIVGTTNTPELGRNGSTEPVLHGPTRNPHRPTHSAGGSSGGTAAAVASGMVPAGHGNDGGGSIRIPASACGLVGLKPSRGRVPSLPRAGAFAYPVGINHALTWTVRDSALLLDVAAGPVPGDAYSAPAPLRSFVDEVGADPGRRRVALTTTTPSGVSVHPEAVAAARAAAEQLEGLGHEVEEVDPPWPTAQLQHASRIVMSVPLAAEVDARLAVLDRELRGDDLEPFTHVLYEMAKTVTGTDLAAALNDVERAGLQLGPFFEQYDILVTPTMPVPPPPLGLLDTTNPESMYQHAGSIAALTAWCNVTGQPAISLPLARYDDGLPLGVQLAAGWGREALLLRVASQLEEAQPWPLEAVWPIASDR